MSIKQSTLDAMTMQQLHNLQLRIIQVMREKQTEGARKFERGQKVSFYHRGLKIVGKVDAINLRTVSVAVPNSRPWRVSPSLLSAA